MSGSPVSVSEEERLTGPCGASWVSDYGPLPCDRPKGHRDRHRTYGSQGAILWRELKRCRHAWVSPPGMALKRRCTECNRREEKRWVPNV